VNEEDVAPGIPLAEVMGQRATESPLRRKGLRAPRNLQTLLLLGIFGLLMLYTLYFTSALVLPIIAAFVLSLMLQPGMRALARLHVPSVVAALLMIIIFFGGLTALGYSLSGPASDWIAKFPEGLARVEKRLSFLEAAVSKIQETGSKVEQLAQTASPASEPVTIKGPGLTGFLLSGTLSSAIGILTTLLLLYFLLSSGDIFLRRLVEVLPRLADKKQAVFIAREIESAISRYLFTVTLMNAGVGVLTGLAAYFCGLYDPVLWGTLAFLLNYVPILGPLFGVAILFMAGLVNFDSTFQALLPAGIYLAIHIIEGETITPMLLARRFTLNPVLIIVSLVFWYWMWGVVGALLAVPLLGTFKIICDRVEPLMAIGHFIGTEAKA
jgi:predicted PurR-regulated permease PerM